METDKNSVLKHKKVLHVVRSNSDIQETSIKEEKILDNGDGFSIEETSSNWRCNCGREVIVGKERTYICQSCSKEMCNDCYFICMAGEILCIECIGIFNSQPVCPSHWISLGIERLYRAKIQALKNKEKEDD